MPVRWVNRAAAANQRAEGRAPRVRHCGAFPTTCIAMPDALPWLRRSLLLILLSLLAGCGFKLRADVAWPAAWQPLEIRSADPVSPLKQELKRRLRQQDVVLVDTEAAAVLEIRRESLQREVLSVDERARVSEYVLHLEVEYLLRAADREVLPAATLRLSRDYSFDELQALGAAQEEEVIETELRREIARRILDAGARAASDPP